MTCLCTCRRCTKHSFIFYARVADGVRLGCLSYPLSVAWEMRKVAVAVPTASCDVKYVDSPSVGKNTIFVRTLTTVITVYGVDLRQGDLTYCLSSTVPRQSII